MTEDELKAWVESVSGANVTFMQRLEGGGSREAWRIDAVMPSGEPRPLFLRRDLGAGPVSGSELTLAREAKLCKELLAAGIPVSSVVGFDEKLDVVLAERAPGGGAADFHELLVSPHRSAIIADFISVLARVHNLDPAVLDLPDFERPVSGADHALLEVARWRRLYEERATEPEPILEAAFDWLARHAPDQVGRTVLVHGDCGPGNFMFQGDHVTCVVDWEFAHFGDAMDDIAWLGFRQDATGDLAFEDFHASLDQWSRETGIELDQGRVAYYGLLILARCAVCAVRGLANAGASIDNSVWHELLPRMRQSIAHLIAELEEVTPDEIEPLPIGPRGDTSRVIETLRREMRCTIAPEITSPNATKRAAGMQKLLDFVAAAERLDPAIERAELSDLAATLGKTYLASTDALPDIVAWIKSEGPEAPEVIRYLCRRADRGLLAWDAGITRTGVGGKYPKSYNPKARLGSSAAAIEARP